MVRSVQSEWILKNENDEKISVPIKRTLRNKLSKVWASFLVMRGTHLIIHRNFVDQEVSQRENELTTPYTLKISRVAKLFGISNKEAIQIIRDNLAD